MILRQDVSGERGVVRKNAVISHLAIVRDVHANHEEIPRADARHQILAGRAVNGHAFPDQIVVPDLEMTAFAFKFHILGLASDGGVFKDAIPLAERGVALDDGVGRNFATRADHDFVFDDGIRAHLNVGGKVRTWVNDSGRVNGHALQTS